MGLFILIGLIAMPIVEIAVFIQVGEQIGLFNTIAIVVLTAIAGTALLRWQGLSVLARAQESLRENRFPVEEIFDGLCLVFAGALLLTPGFVTDTIGFLLFLAPVRLFIKGIIVPIVARRTQVHMSGGFRTAPREDGVIDGDFQDVTDRPTISPDKITGQDSQNRANKVSDKDID